jgi:RNA polymerase sigma-70 factor (ECF subfamily)
VNSIARSQPYSLKDALLDRCVAGDESAWRALYMSHSAMVARFLRRLGVRQVALEYAVQDVFVEAFRGLGKFRGDAALKTWLYRLSVTQARRARRKARFVERLRGVLQLGLAEDVDFGTYAPCQAERLLHTALAQLTNLERETFVLYELEGQSGAQVSVILGCPEPTVYRRLHDARRKFTARLTEALP